MTKLTNFLIDLSSKSLAALALLLRLDALHMTFGHGNGRLFVVTGHARQGQAEDQHAKKIAALSVFLSRSEVLQVLSVLHASFAELLARVGLVLICADICGGDLVRAFGAGRKRNKTNHNQGFLQNSTPQG